MGETGHDQLAASNVDVSAFHAPWCDDELRGTPSLLATLGDRAPARAGGPMGGGAWDGDVDLIPPCASRTSKRDRMSPSRSPSPERDLMCWADDDGAAMVVVGWVELFGFCWKKMTERDTRHKYPVTSVNSHGI
jgi:hypothetical protein